MTKEELAAKLNGREYGHEITGVEESAAKAAELLVIFGASDDLCELRGAIHDEVDACDGTTVAMRERVRTVEPDPKCPLCGSVGYHGCWKCRATKSMLDGKGWITACDECKGTGRLPCPCLGRDDDKPDV